MQKYVVLDKKVGETPLSCMEAWRRSAGLASDIPLTYAGRLDPLASGKLLVLIGEECKAKERYQALDKAYDFSILFGVGSDSGDVLGLINSAETTSVTKQSLSVVLSQQTGTITLPYPVFSSKPVNGKPLHTWAVEGRLDEIIIPTATTHVYHLSYTSLTTMTRDEVFAQAQEKVESIPHVTELRKALGNDFRRADIRQRWQEWRDITPADTQFTLAHCQVICSSGTYVRSLAAHIGKQLNTKALAFSIHRTRLGHYRQLGPLGYFWPSF
jgi:tRNA pseudouridine(55) synthase